MAIEWQKAERAGGVFVDWEADQMKSEIELMRKAAAEFRAALVELQRWVMLHLIIPDGDLATQSQLVELLSSAEAAAMRAGISLDAHEPEKPAFGDRLRIPYHGGLTLVNRKWSGAKVLEAGHSWSVHIRALVRVAERVASGVDDWHPETKTHLWTAQTVLRSPQTTALLSAIELSIRLRGGER